MSWKHGRGRMVCTSVKLTFECGATPSLIYHHVGLQRATPSRRDFHINFYQRGFARCRLLQTKRSGSYLLDPVIGTFPEA